MYYYMSQKDDTEVRITARLLYLNIPLMGFVNCMHISEDRVSRGTIKGFTHCTSY